MIDRRRTLECLLACLLAAASTAPVSEAADVDPTKEFGADTSITTLLSTSFAPRDAGYVDDAYAYRSGSQPTVFRAGIDLPTGTQILSVEWEVCDFEPATFLQFIVRKCFRPIPPGDPGNCVVVAVVNSDSVLGCHTEIATAGSFNTIDNLEAVYMAEVTDPDAVATTGFRSARIRWRRQVSPAPATATFTDVPSSHFAFRYIEALSRAGITGGCAPGEFCPNRNLTRAEMAVFLATALGLHWPN